MLRSSLLSVAVFCFAIAVAPAAENGKRAVLDDGTIWRANLVWISGGSKKFRGFRYTSPLPPENWAAAEFDDASWLRWRIGRRHSRYFAYGIGGLSPNVRLVCMRGKFTVEDPAAAKLTLNFSYRGGVAVYVNGKEVARQQLPADAKLDTLAEAYPKDAFYSPDGKALKSVGSALGKQYKRNAELRVRRLKDLAIPAKALRKGVNILALEIHASPFEAKVARKNNSNFPCMWTPCGPISFSLSGTGAAANTARPKGLQAWAAPVAVRPGTGEFLDPHENTGTVRIAGARNGIFCGQAILASDTAVKGVEARMSDLKHEDDRSVITSSNAEVLYAYYRAGRYGAPFLKKPDPRGSIFDPLSSEAPGEVRTQPIWVKVRVPADAVPGMYKGVLSVAAGGKRTDVSVHMTVADWNLPDPKEYISLAGLIQSPDSIALRYKVPMWSEEHFKLLEKSYELMGQAGGKFVWLPLTTRTNLGNAQTIVRWIKKGDNGSTTYRPDFKVLDRYLDLVQKHMNPKAVCLYAYERYTDYAARSRATPSRIQRRGATWKHRGMPGTDAWRISVLDPRTGEVSEELAPRFRESTYDPKTLRVSVEKMLPQNRAFYADTLKSILQRLEKRGLRKAVMIGTEEDVGAKRSTLKFFAELLPGAKWVRMCHPVQSSSRIGYNSAVYVSFMSPPIPWDAKRRAGWQLAGKMVGLFPRSGGATGNYLAPNSPPGVYRVATEACQLTSLNSGLPMQGLARLGADFWPLGAKKTRQGITRTSSVCARYMESCWDQLNMDRSVECMFAPGKNGAITTIRFENYREGIQECEARIFIEKAIVSGKLDDALKKKCQELLDERHNIIRAACAGGSGGINWYGATGSHGLAEKLFACAAEVSKNSGAQK